MNDPQITNPDLTAYALGELDPDAAARIETLLENDQEARAIVAQTRQTAEQLEDALGVEAIGGLKDEQRNAIDQELARATNTDGPSGTGGSILARFGPISALAACLVGAACLWVLNRPDDSAPARTVAGGSAATLDPNKDGALAADDLSLHDEVAEGAPIETRVAAQVNAIRRDQSGVGTGGSIKPIVTKLNDDAVALASAPKRQLAEAVVGHGKKNVETKGDADNKGRGAGRVKSTQPQTGALQSSTVTVPAEAKDATSSFGQKAKQLSGAFDKSVEKTAAGGKVMKKAPNISATPPPAVADAANAAQSAPARRAANTNAKKETPPAATRALKTPPKPSPAAPSPNATANPAGVALESLAKATAAPGAASRQRLAGRAKAFADREGAKRRPHPDHVVIYPPQPRPPRHPAPIPVTQPGNEFEAFTENTFTRPFDAPRSTLSADVDTASFALIRRYLMQNKQLPPRNAVRVEEMVNYFHYDYAEPKGKHPFSVSVEIASAPWAPTHRLVRIGLQAKHVEAAQRPQANLVFLIDVSGSMRAEDKLPLLKQSLRKLVNTLDGDDRIAIVTYSGHTRLALASTPVGQKQLILDAIEGLRASGSTNGGAGIQQAYKTAKEHFIKNGVNRVIMTTDGDFNVGITNRDELNKLIEEKRRTGVYLSVLGFGFGNLKDATMKNLAKRGNGNYAYIDRWEEGHKVLVEEAGSTLQPIAKDVKFDVEFNPATVGSYRLIGYEKRQLAAADFNDDKKDAGEVGSGHTVTVLYEIVPVGVKGPVPAQDPLRYTKKDGTKKVIAKPVLEEKHGGEVFFVRIRYKAPNGDKSTKLAFPAQDSGTKYADASADFKLAATTTGFALMLRNSKYKGNLNYAALLEMAEDVVDARKEAEKPDDAYRRELIKMIRQAKMLSGQ